VSVDRHPLWMMATPLAAYIVSTIVAMIRLIGGLEE
jgi:hypothetical protein